MRVDVDKFLFVGSKTSQDKFFSFCQKKGIVEFSSDRKKEISSKKLTCLKEALKVLKSYDPGILEDIEQKESLDFSPHECAKEILELNKTIDELIEEKKTAEKEIVKLSPLGDFSYESLLELSKKTKKRISFFHMKSKEEKFSSNNVFFINTAHNLDYYFVLGIPPKSLTQIAMEFQVTSSSEDWEIKVDYIEKKIVKLQKLLSKNLEYFDFIYNEMLQVYDVYNFEKARSSSLVFLEDKVFSIQGWIPKDEQGNFLKDLKKINIYFEKIDLLKDEIPPSFLRNKGANKIGEDLVSLYDTPSHRDKDPSLWVLSCFVVFFSMIIEDCGYGLLFLTGSLFCFKIKKKTPLLKRMAILGVILGIGCCLWGTLTNSCFGLTISPDSSLKKYSLTDFLINKKASYFLKNKPLGYQELIHDYPSLKESKSISSLLKTVVKDQGFERKYVIYDSFQDNVMLEISLFIGALHIMSGFIRYRKYNSSWSGWILFIFGAYLYFPTYLKATSLIHYLFHIPYEKGGGIGFYLMFCGVLLAVSLAIKKKKLAGLEEITLVIQVFSDILSYLRIYALALAGGMMASTFNLMAKKSPFILGFVIIVLGHSVNIILAIMGGVIHGLRLNFIEWYHYSFEGGGRNFSPLRKLYSKEQMEEIC